MLGGTWLYVDVLAGDAPAALELSPAAPAATGGTAPAGVDGTYAVTAGSQVGYRVREVLFGQSRPPSAARAR